MQVLSLSELPLTEGEPGSQFNVPGWVKERDALLATVESLKGLITQIQTHRETQVEETPHESLQNTAYSFPELNQSETSQFKAAGFRCQVVIFRLAL